ncbi:MAG: hypothetical protein LLG04_12830 [Parachlamydia sp.]|nr:hypothetical protein [Parachlamydia sp.]
MSGEIILCRFTSTNDESPHRKCVERHCVRTGKPHSACINVKLAQFLDERKSGYEALKNQHCLQEASDWCLLEQALISPSSSSHAVMSHFALRKQSYGLRYRSHSEIGKTFVLQLLRSYRAFFQPLETLWGRGISKDLIEEYEKLFLALCQKSEHMTSDGIYRLYDLCHECLNKDGLVDSKKFKITHFLSLLFAFGHTGRHPKVLSIDELVAKYQFFAYYADEFNEGFLTRFKFNSSQKEISHAYLKAEGSGICADNLWKGFLVAAQNLFTNNITTINYYQFEKLTESLIKPMGDLTHFAGQIKNMFSNPMIYRPAYPQAQKFPLTFRYSFDAAYHPFKHEEASQEFYKKPPKNFFDCNFKSERDFILYAHESLCDYLHMMHDIIHEGQLVYVLPDQFRSATRIKFEKKQISSRGVARSYGVLVRCSEQGVSYLLTCF